MVVSESTERDTIDLPDQPELRSGWSWWSGEVSASYYTKHLGTDYVMGGALAGDGQLGGYMGEVYYDEGGDGLHKVQLYPVVGKEDNDPVYAEHPEVSRTYETAEEAFNAVPNLIEELYE